MPVQNHGLKAAPRLAFGRATCHDPGMYRAGVLVSLLVLLALVRAQQPQPAISGFFPAAVQAQRDFEASLDREADASNIVRHHRRLTEDPHVAGTPEGKKVADYVLAEFRKAGLEARQESYDVLLSYPVQVQLELTRPEQISLANREAGYAADKDTFDPRVSPPWHAYAASGEVSGPVVYANFGRREDYQRLEELGVDVEGKIVIVRYFQGYRGGKSLEAEGRGVKALIVYSDPAEDGYARGETYPDGPWGPAGKVQRGANVYDFRVPGDPLTPGWASVPGARRLAESESTVLPKIPTLPLSHADAEHVLRNLAGEPVPEGWQGGLPFTYHIGPGPAEVHLKLEISREVRPIHNVIAVIPGREEPDREVIASNHHDAWVYGGVDPSSGTAVMLELARVLGERVKAGWRPRRTIVLGCWDAEEYTLTGSTEWGEQHAAELADAVACLNVDAASSGPSFAASAVPSLRRFIMEATGAVADPRSGLSVFEVWKRSRDGGNIRGYAVSVSDEAPVDIGILGSGSDYTVFFNHLGVPSVDMLFDGPYGVYHSQYDTHRWVSRIGDPGFAYHRAMVVLWGTMASRLAEADWLPFHYSDYARDLTRYLEDLQEQAGGGLSLQGPSEAARALEQSARRVEEWLGGAGASEVSPQQLERVNAALLAVERDFLSEDGIPGRPWFKHQIYAPLPSYAAQTLPGVREALAEGETARAQTQARRLERSIRQAADRLEALLP